MCGCVGHPKALKVNTSKPTLRSFVTVGMRYVDVMMYTSTEAEKLSALAPELLLRILSNLDQMPF